MLHTLNLFSTIEFVLWMPNLWLAHQISVWNASVSCIHWICLRIVIIWFICQILETYVFFTHITSNIRVSLSHLDFACTCWIHIPNIWTILAFTYPFSHFYILMLNMCSRLNLYFIYQIIDLHLLYTHYLFNQVNFWFTY